MLPRRLAFRKLLSTVLTTAALSAQSAPAIEVASRSAQEQLERALYGTGAPEMQSYQQQINDAVSIRTMRGVWQLREFPMAGGSPIVGTLTFRGAGTEAKVLSQSNDVIVLEAPGRSNVSGNELRLVSDTGAYVLLTSPLLFNGANPPDLV